MVIRLDTPIQSVQGVGPRRWEMFSRVHIHTAEDLLRYKPLRYEDRTCFKPIGQLRPEESSLIQGRVAVMGRYTTPRKRMKIFKMKISDSTGLLDVKFFNQPHLDKVFQEGQQVLLFEVPALDPYNGESSLLNPEYEIMERVEQSVHMGRIVPIYRKIGQLSTKALRQMIFLLLEDLDPEMEDPLPSYLCKKHGFPSLRPAFRQLHFPICPQAEARAACLVELNSGRSSAHRRFVFEEFFTFQLGLQVLKKHRERFHKKRTIKVDPKIRGVVRSVLSFPPTAAQKKVLKEIVSDLRGRKVMSRLLQGDVGSGKTIVAVQAMMLVIENGYQTSLMAPTEILVEQHYRNISRYLGSSCRVVLLTSAVKGKQRQRTLAQIESGEIDLVVGTQALTQAGVKFRNLALVVVDEQHRFGVLQRSQLMKKGDHPDTLVMTATPIPRSLALTLYGDLDISLIDEMPPGRQPVQTLVQYERDRKQVYGMMAQQLKEGRQAYIIYPLVEESEKLDLKAASEMAERLRGIFGSYRVALMHGRLKADRKEDLMRRFQNGEIHLLASTTVVEVGIDVPNATFMLVEHAERFGLSQLHQLRGRVGRGRHSSLCVLMCGETGSREARERLDIMQQTRDGFKIAERDLEIRGPGQLVGTRQSGMPEFVFGNVIRDREVLETARSEASEFLAHLLKSSSRSERKTISEVAARWKARYDLSEVG